MSESNAFYGSPMSESNALPQNRRLERLFETAHTHAWNGPEVVRQSLPYREDATEGYLGRLRWFASFMLAVEEVAWQEALQLARELPTADARLAATAQAGDEANHYVTVRAYLATLSGGPAPLSPHLRSQLDSVTSCPDAVEKFLRLHLTIENVTTALFRRFGASGRDQVLSKLTAYSMRDESRHLTFCQLYLPELVAAGTPDDIERWRGAWRESQVAMRSFLEAHREDLLAFDVQLEDLLEEVGELELELAAISPVLSAVVSA